ncbi:hypothetical protein HMPREF1986_01821 [Oribacterium sp. oral taxon 078 str. F0263]|nr:hypothetical protein HMPREF1986_01821 [Oribacterium sp. oral taxon 078 str. F0263]
MDPDETVKERSNGWIAPPQAGQTKARISARPFKQKAGRMGLKREGSGKCRSSFSVLEKAEIGQAPMKAACENV